MRESGRSGNMSGKNFFGSKNRKPFFEHCFTSASKFSADFFVSSK